jgi:hypothetical protein
MLTSAASSTSRDLDRQPRGPPSLRWYDRLVKRSSLLSTSNHYLEIHKTWSEEPIYHCFISTSHLIMFTAASRRVLQNVAGSSTSVCSNNLPAFFPAVRCMSSIPSTMKVRLMMTLNFLQSLFFCRLYIRCFLRPYPKYHGCPSQHVNALILATERHQTLIIHCLWIVSSWGYGCSLEVS